MILSTEGRGLTTFGVMKVMEPELVMTYYMVVQVMTNCKVPAGLTCYMEKAEMTRCLGRRTMTNSLAALAMINW